MSDKKKILLCDDDQDFAKVLALRLSQANFDVAIACDSYQVIQMTRKIKPDCIITDIDMPGGGAHRALKSINQSIDTMQTPIICMSGSDPDGSHLGEFKKGMLFQKPVNTEELIKAIHTATGSVAPS